MNKIFGGSPLAVALQLAVVSIIVGVILSALGWGPGDLVLALRDFAHWLSNLSFDAVEHLFGYLVLGAIIVVPVWLILRVLKVLGGNDTRGEPR
jgi:hypothetical protein